MRICANCGATNKDDKDRFCRTCGALLPVKRPPRIRMGSNDLNRIEQTVKTPVIIDNKNKPATNYTNRTPPPRNIEAQFFSSKKTKGQELNLQEIPKETPQKVPQINSSSKSKPKVKELKKINITEIPDSTDDDERVLREIKPKPFSGSIIASREVYGSPKANIIEEDNHEIQLSNTTATLNDSNIEDALYKRKRLEEDMTNVLGFLSEKLKSGKLEKIQKSQSKQTKERITEKIPPSNLNEILKSLIKLDLHIEASALIEKDGTILASAISNRISDPLFATIGQNLTMIGKDIIDGLSAGKLKSISVRGTDGILDLAPIDKAEPNMNSLILIIFSHPKIKSGIISMAVSIVKKQIMDFLTTNK